MKQLLLLTVLLILASAAFSQTGKMGLYYGENISSACKNLENQGYTMIYNVDVLRKYAKDTLQDACGIDLIFDPATQSLVGWTLNYDTSIEGDRQTAIVDDFVSLHGKDFSFLEEQQMACWGLGNSRSCSLGFDDNGNLAVAVYFDDAKVPFFDRSETQNDRWRSLRNQ